MRLAFVIRLGNESRPGEGLFEGWVEEVDSCIERRFRSAEELLAFLGQRFDLATNSIGKTLPSDCEEVRIKLKNARSKTRSS
jgi:hypothetical protein